MSYLFNGQALRKLRKQKGQTQASLAESADCSEHYISDLETGKRSNPSADILMRISKSLDVPGEAFLDFHSHPDN